MENTATERKRRTLSSNVITKPMVTIVIPTWENQKLLEGCLQSLFENTILREFQVFVVNNGTAGTLQSIDGQMDGRIKVFDMGSNLGWEGGINAVLDKVDTEYIMLLNDDTHIPPNDPIWINKMLSQFRDENVGAVGPSSNYVMQKQNIFWNGLPRRMNVPVLIGLCLLIKTNVLKSLGGLGKDLPGGDDLDLSIKLTDMGLKLRCMRDVFIYHHGAQTGRRVYGRYWDSEEHQDKTNIELIRRNGFKKFLHCRFGHYENIEGGQYTGTKPDAEGDLIRKYVVGERVLELGCGAQKTVEKSSGLDIFGKGETIPTLAKNGNHPTSVADIKAEATQTGIENESFDCIIARHLLEHMIDPVLALNEWDRILKLGGRLIIAVPDHAISNTIPLNPEHVHAYTKESLTNLVYTVLNYKPISVEYANNGVSFVGVYEKN